jgi:hypothetical protein
MNKGSILVSQSVSQPDNRIELPFERRARQNDTVENNDLVFDLDSACMATGESRRLPRETIYVRSWYTCAVMKGRQ